MLRLVSLLLLLALPAKAEEIVLGLSQDEVAITATFEGSEILIFGAIKREAPAPVGDAGIIITVAGPEEPVLVRRKARRFGIWVNTDEVEIDAAPTFYAVASSAPLDSLLDPAEDLRHRITIPKVIRDDGTELADSAAFSEALTRIRAGQNLYQLRDSAVDFEDGTLFRSALRLPANLTEGDYTARIFLTREGAVVDTYQTEIPVKKVGLERWLYNLAHEQALIYGLMSLAIAIAAGWAASAAFSLLRR